jgi:hypothetical protein
VAFSTTSNYLAAYMPIGFGLRQNFLKSLRLTMKFLAFLFSNDVRVT